MSAWATIFLTLGSSAIAASAALIGVERSNRHASREREALAAAARRESAGRVLGKIQALLGDMEPSSIALNINNTSLQRLPLLHERWLGLRDELAVFAATDGSPAIRTIAPELASAIFNTFNRLGLLIEEQVRHSGIDTKELYEAATENYVTAVSLSGRLLDLVHGDAESRPSGGLD